MEKLFEKYFLCKLYEKLYYTIYITIHHQAYNHQTWYGGDLSWGASTHQATCLFDQLLKVMSCDKIKTLYIHFYKACKHRTLQSCDLG